jgi:hypothetical protein
MDKPNVESVEMDGDLATVTVSHERMNFKFAFACDMYDDEYEGRPERRAETMLQATAFVDWDGNAFTLPEVGPVPEEVLRVAEVEAVGHVTQDRFRDVRSACEVAAEAAATLAYEEADGQKFNEPDLY